MLVCDLCKKRVEAYDSLILYSKRIDYCKTCKPKIKKIKNYMKKRMKQILQYNKDNFDKEARKAELMIIERMRGM